MNEEIYLRLWAKTVRDDPQKYHPVLFHLLDVGYCAALLWDECLSAVRKAVVAREWGLSQAQARQAVVWLAAWHDIGKVSPGFQYQKFNAASGPQFLWQRLLEVGFPKASGIKSMPHAQISAQVLMQILESGEAGWQVDDGQSRLILAHIAGAHHGIFPHSGEIESIKSDILGDGLWHEARLAMVKQTAQLLTPTSSFTMPCFTWPVREGGCVGWLAGLISVADWLGSSEHFPAAGHELQKLPSAQEYARTSAERARGALQEFGWLPGFEANHSPLDFEKLFGFEPNALQSAMLDCVENIEGPFLAIAEAQMGVGKTETAFVAIDAALRGLFASGFYIALPTQATSNAMHDRVRDNYLKKRQGHNPTLNLQLAHAGALLKDEPEEEASEIVPTGIDAQENPAEATVAAQSWFTLRKRPLLAPFGVGTIDQSLMGVLQTKHWFVRTFGLANKVIVFDEVHAYSSFMSTLLDRLIAWLRANGCSVVLLSGTLPSSRRHQLLKAWGAGLPTEEANYPRLTWCVPGHESRSLSVAQPNTPSKEITLKFASGNASELAALLRKKLEDGGCAAIICNTVKNAQTLFQDLKAELGEDFCDKDHWHLFHARMPFAWRQDREQKILKAFGKDKSNRPYRAIVISTQVLEQSLDLCFSWMASELAPIDLLLQRLGRLHRHWHTVHPAGLRQAEFTILCEGWENAAPPVLSTPDTMYSHYILLQTWLALRGKDVLSLPHDIEPLIEAVYEKGFEAPDEVWQEWLDSARQQMEAGRCEAARKANVVAAPKPNHAVSVANTASRGLHDDDDPATHETMRAATRDGDPSIQVVCLVRNEQGVFIPPLPGSEDSLLPVDLTINPDRRQTRALLRSALPLSHRKLYHALCVLEAPPGWRENPHLRYARALEFCDGRVEIAGITLRLCEELGLVIEDSKTDASS